MKGKKFIAIISIVCILAVMLCIPAFATVTESAGDGFALYNGFKLPNIDTVWNDKNSLPYAIISASTDYYSVLILLEQPVVYDGDHYVKVIDSYLASYIFTLDEEIATILDIEIGIWNYSMGIADDSTYLADIVSWTSHDIINTTNNSVYLAASNPISLDGYNLIEWDGDTTGLVEDADNLFVLDNVRRPAVDGFAVMEFSYSTTPIVLDEFLSVPDYGWFVAGPTSSYELSCANGLVEPVDSDDYWVTVALKFDDVDDTGYTSLIAYRTVENPPGEGGDEPDDPQPPFWAIEI